MCPDFLPIELDFDILHHSVITRPWGWRRSYSRLFRRLRLADNNGVSSLDGLLPAGGCTQKRKRKAMRELRKSHIQLLRIPLVPCFSILNSDLPLLVEFFSCGDSLRIGSGFPMEGGADWCFVSACPTAMLRSWLDHVLAIGVWIFSGKFLSSVIGLYNRGVPSLHKREFQIPFSLSEVP